MSKSKQQSTTNDNKAKDGLKHDAKTKDKPTKDMPKTAKGDHKDKPDMSPKLDKQDKHTRNKSDDKKTSKTK
ncbi:hypothetical protein FBU31_003585 [Coemansia sp. 'formosensis']|nr:hypothetical protein FBU31_003585 [Coemansia sp. 'formosensis']